jgi:ABC-type Mn2+/Zn2+ transport system permease subunit
VAVAVSLTSFLVGMFMSFAVDTPIGASIVICNMVAFLLLSVVSAVIKKVK